MTQAEITKLVEPFLTNITFFEDKSFVRSEYIVEGKIIGIYYFEYSNDNLSEEEIAQFQEDNISSDYYNHPGYLQWNYYLIFVRSHSVDSTELKHRVEKNDEYTRKFVFNSEEILDYFTYSRSNQTVDSDIVSKWKEKLRAVDLDEVYTDSYYSDAIPRFLNNGVEKENITEQNIATPANQAIKIDTISKLILQDSFRKHPNSRRTFDFTKVNLIFGANGTGKTSLLTAIELILAGKSINDPSGHEAINSISAIFNGDEQLSDDYSPNDNLKYRVRDAAWYSSSYQTGNELYRAFNRYNYFDSDAAYKLAFDEDNRNITKYLSAIALGPEFGRIQDRMRGFEERLARELRTREKTIETQDSRIDDAEKIVRAISLASDPQKLFGFFISAAAENGWSKILPQNITDDPSVYEKDHQEASAIIATLIQMMESAKIRNIEIVKTLAQKIASDIDKVQEAKAKYDKAKQKSQEIKTQLEQSEKKINLLGRAKIYFDNIDSFYLPTIEDEISTLETQIKNHEIISDTFTSISQNEIFKSSEKLGDAKKRIDKARTDALRGREDANQQKEILKETLGKLQALVSDIKALGTQYLSLNDQATTCPLCSSSFSNTELNDRISRIDIQSSEELTLKIFNDQILTADEMITNHATYMAEIDRIERLIGSMYNQKIYQDFTFLKIYEELSEVQRQLQLNIGKNSDLAIKKSKLEQIGITKSVFLTFKSDFEQWFPNLPFEFVSKTEYSKILVTTEQDLENLKNDWSNSTTIEDGTKKDLEELLNEANVPYSEVDVIGYLKYRSSSLEKIIEEATRLKSFIAFNDSEEFTEVSEKLNTLSIAFGNYRKSLSDQTQLDSARQTIDSATQQKSELEPIVHKLNIALLTLREILNHDKEDVILGDFLKGNEKEIQEIFISLHTPKEFSQIVFNYDSKNVYLQKKDTRDQVPLNKISTGQRSALAISIFLALHKKINKGPQILIFDDPVTYTDDLNTLSFLDCLRELVIKEKRQLFLVTANQKFAGLFEKKFAFLGTECQTIELERID